MESRREPLANDTREIIKLTSPKKTRSTPTAQDVVCNNANTK